jgi:hypothetical protein
MIVRVHNCSMNGNEGHGLTVEDFWKGPISITECKLNTNKQSGANFVANRLHNLQGKSVSKLNHSSLIATLMEKKKMGSMTLGGTMSRSKVVPSNLFVEESTKIKQPSSYVNPLKHLQA